MSLFSLLKNRRNSKRSQRHANRRRRRLAVEGLEKRRLMTTGLSVAGNVLQIDADYFGSEVQVWDVLELTAGSPDDFGTVFDPTPAQGAPLVSSHAYIAEKVNYTTVNLGGFGTITIPVSVVLRNPWRSDGAGNDGNNDGLVTVTGEQFVAAMYSSHGVDSAWV